MVVQPPSPLSDDSRKVALLLQSSSSPSPYDDDAYYSSENDKRTTNVASQQGSSAATTPTTTPTTKPCFYIRHVLSLNGVDETSSSTSAFTEVDEGIATTIPTKLPKVGRDDYYPEISHKDWSTFWISKIYPIIALSNTRCSSNLLAKIALIALALWLMAAIYFLYLVIQIMHATTTTGTTATTTTTDDQQRLLDNNDDAARYHWILYTLIGTAILVFVPFNVWISYTRKKQMCSIQDMLCDPQQHLLFRKHGYTVQCSLDRHDSNSKERYGFSFYFIPLVAAAAGHNHNNGSITNNPIKMGNNIHQENHELCHCRIELYNPLRDDDTNWPFCCWRGGWWTPVSMTDLERYRDDDDVMMQIIMGQLQRRNGTSQLTQHVVVRCNVEI